MQLGPDYDLAMRIKRIEDTLARMGQNPLGQAFSATQSDGSVGLEILQDPSNSGGTITAWFQGPNTARDPQTGQHPPLLVIGESFVGGVPGDSVVVTYYPAGGESMTVGAGGVGLLDPKGNVVFTPDQPAGEGLGKPYLNLPLPVNSKVSTWPSTNATSWATVAYSQFVQQSPKIAWYAFVQADAGTTGECRLNVNGTLSAVQPITTTASTVSDVIALPAGFYGQEQLVSVEAQVTSGTGSVWVNTYALYGRGS